MNNYAELLKQPSESCDYLGFVYLEVANSKMPRKVEHAADMPSSFESSLPAAEKKNIHTKL